MRSVPIVLIERSRLVREGLEKILSGTMFRVAATAPTPGDLRATLPADLRGLMIILGVGDDDHSPAEEIEALGLDAESWTTRLAESRTRQSLGPDGHVFDIDDTVVLLQRA